MASAFRAMEGHELGGSAVRGGEGPLRISVDRDKNPLHEAYIAAGLEMGLPRVSDLNDLGPDGQGVGYATRTISRGRRQSSAQAFLRRARTRPNLHVMTGATVERIVFEGKRAAAVEAVVAGARQRIDCAGEIILSAGALMSPQILERSGIGQATRLRPFGIEPIHDSRGVGEHMFEHRLLMTQYEVDSPHTDNHELRGLRLVKNAARYFLGGGGKMSAGYGTVAAFAKVLPESPTADIEIIYTPLVVMPDAQGRLRPDQVPSIQIFGYPLRSRSEGHIHISGPGLAAPADLRANYLTDAYDQRVTIAMFRYIREWMEQGALASIAPRERELTASLHTDEEILAAFRSNGQAGYHACGTCRMGAFADAVVDERCRVKGVAGLRVIDASIMPSMVSANTNGPAFLPSSPTFKTILISLALIFLVTSHISSQRATKLIGVKAIKITSIITIHFPL